MKSVVLLSGGMDSATCLAVAFKAREEIHALTFDYGQSNRCEIPKAVYLASRYKAVDHKVFSVDLGVWGGSAITGTSSSPKTTAAAIYVPFRNAVFLSLGVSYAEAIGARRVYIGSTLSPHRDNSGAYLDAFQRLINEGTPASRDAVELVAPLSGKPGEWVVRLALELKVPLADTWTCFFPKYDPHRPCGECSSCVSRAEAFRVAGIEDPALKGKV